MRARRAHRLRGLGQVDVDADVRRLDVVEQAAKTGMPVPEGGLRIILRPNGVNLPYEDDAAWLLERVIAHMPDVLIIGPLYRLHYDNPNEESIARRVMQALDVARNTVDCAVMVGAIGATPRPVRPGQCDPPGQACTCDGPSSASASKQMRTVPARPPGWCVSSRGADHETSARAGLPCCAARSPAGHGRTQATCGSGVHDAGGF